jgi:hypothetical protein
MRFLGTQMDLQKAEKEILEINHLSEAEVFTLASKAPNEMFRQATIAYFGTGVRQGEGLMISQPSFTGEREISIGK